MSNQKKIKVLIAEDDAPILEATKMLLELENYEVIALSDGNSLMKLHKNLPDVILLDIWLSGANGSEIAKHLKSNENTKHIPIIMFSANRNIENIAKEVRADDFLVKPYDIEELTSIIKKYLP